MNKATDAVKAGEAPATDISQRIQGWLSNPMFLVWFYFMGWPWISK